DGDSEARLSPQRGDAGSVDLGASGLGVVEVAPREDRDAAQTGRRGDIGEPGRVAGLPHLGRTVTGVGRIAQGRGLRRTDRQRARRGDSRSRPWLPLGSRLLGPACPLYARTLERRGTGAGHEMKLTGERPMQGATPDSLLAFHDAGYREVVARLGTGVVVDVGCGVGDETRRLT